MFRDLSATAAPAPASSNATMVNSTVPAAPVSGSWVMDFTFFTVIAPSAPEVASPSTLLPPANAKVAFLAFWLMETLMLNSARNCLE